MGNTANCLHLPPPLPNPQYPSARPQLCRHISRGLPQMTSFIIIFVSVRCVALCRGGCHVWGPEGAVTEGGRGPRTVLLYLRPLSLTPSLGYVHNWLFFLLQVQFPKMNSPITKISLTPIHLPWRVDFSLTLTWIDDYNKKCLLYISLFVQCIIHFSSLKLLN